MKFIYVLLALLLFGQAEGASLRCDNCSLEQARDVARSAGPGEHYVLDYERTEIRRFSVWYEHELSRWFAVDRAVDPQVLEGFLDFAEARSLSPQLAVANSVVVVISPSDPDWVFIDPRGEIANFDAHMVARDRSLRGMVSRQLGAGLLTQGDQGRLQSVSYRILTLVASALHKAGAAVTGGGNPETLTVVLRWKNGSTSTFTVGPSSVHYPEYAVGKSTDSEGRLLPDESALRCPTCYVGEWSFTDISNRDRWVDLARVYGIQISTSSTLYTCAWDNVKKELRCLGSIR